jgi:hypothetical protein
MIRLLFGVFVRAFAILAIGGVLLLLSSVLEQSNDPTSFAAASFFGVLALIAGGFAPPVVLYYLALAPAAMIVEGVKPKEALSRSRYLMKKHKLHQSTSDSIISLWVIMFVMTLLIMGGLYSGFGYLGFFTWAKDVSGRSISGQAIAGVVGMLPAYLSLWLVTPIWVTGTTVLYFERRARLEAYDISILAEDAKRASSRVSRLR